jgi:hypothetical protein
MGIFGKKHFNIKRFGKKLGRGANKIARKTLNTIEKIADNPYLGMAADAFVPGASQGLQEIGDGVHGLNQARGNIVNFANGNHEEAPRNEILY